MPKMNGKPTVSEAVREALTEDFRPFNEIHRRRLEIMGQADQYPSGSGATQVILQHLIEVGVARVLTSERRGRVYALIPTPYEASEDSPCRAVVRFRTGRITQTGAQCVMADMHMVHEAESPLHEPGTGVVVQWRGDDASGDPFGSARMIRWVDAVSGAELDADDPRLHSRDY